MSDLTAPPPACSSSSSANSPDPPQQHQERPHNGQAPPPAPPQLEYGYGPAGANSTNPAQQKPLYDSQAFPAATTFGYGYPPQHVQPALLPGAVETDPPQQHSPQFPVAGAIPMTVPAPMVAPRPVMASVVDLPMEDIIELDLRAVRRIGNASERKVCGRNKRWAPIPLVWLEADWAKKPFVYVSSRVLRNTTGSDINIHTYRCVLHRLDGAPCGAIVETTTETALADHLRAFHSIVEPARRERRWKHSLLSGLCSLACIDFMLMPCCFVSRMQSIMQSIGLVSSDAVFVASYERGQLCCDSCDSDCCCNCIEWAAVMINVLFTLLLPCIWCCGYAACKIDLELRRSIVSKHNIVETEYQSGMAVCWCCPCSAIQVHREIESAGVWPGYSCCYRNAPLRSPEEVQQDYNAITREDVVRSRQGYNAFGRVMQ